MFQADMSESPWRFHMWISGRVQGVCYRASTQHQARQLGLTGLVRNLTDGRVEVIAEGPRADLEALQRWCERGPERAVVAEVRVVELAATGEFTRFDVA